MEKYQGCSEGFEPSADELIDVLKNLENLAAANPILPTSYAFLFAVCIPTAKIRMKIALAGVARGNDALE